MKEPELKNLQSKLDDLELVLHQMVLIDRAIDIEELNSALQLLLESIGDYTRADRVYTFEYSKETGIYRNSNEWCADGVVSQIDNLQSVSDSEMPYWHDKFLVGDSVVIENLDEYREIMPLEYEILKPQNVHTVVVFPMYHQKDLKGFIGLDNPVLDRSRRFINLLAVVGGHLGSAYDSIYKEQEIADKELIAEEANRANEAKTEFLSRMAHDIRTPMNAVMGFAEIAEKHVDDSEKVTEYLGKIRTAGRFLQQIVDDVLDLTRIESGRMTLNPEVVSIHGFLEEYFDIMKEIQMDKNLRFKCDFHDIIHSYLIFDSLRLKQIYMNLLSNAVKYTPEGGEVRFEVFEEEIPDSTDLKLVSVISDTGIGMSEEYMQKMYDKFTRAVDTRVNEVRGSGLGLSIVKGIVDEMKGTIEVESRPGKGTTFRIELIIPWRDKTEDTKDSFLAKTERPFFRNRNVKILVAEDNELNYEVAEELLKSYGITCERAENGHVCIRKFNDSELFEYQAILMDVQMPVMNGIEATKKLRLLKRKDAQTVPVIALTANAFKTDMECCLAAGMTAHLSKPLDVRELIKILYKHLHGEESAQV